MRKNTQRYDEPKKTTFWSKLRNSIVPFGAWGINAGGYPMETGNIPPKPYNRPYTPHDLRTVVTPLQTTRIAQDVATWRAALHEAENAWLPYRYRMQQMYADTILNGHVASCMEKRRNMTRLREFEVVNDKGKVNEKWTQFFHTQWFEQMSTFILDAKFFGYSLIVIGDVVDGEIDDCTVIKRENVSSDRDNVSNLPYMPSGTPFLEGDQEFWHVWVTVPSEIGWAQSAYGLLYNCAYYEILMRAAVGHWSDFTEVFGQPLRWAKTNKRQSDPEYDLLKGALVNLASLGVIITDLEDEVEIVETKMDNGKDGVYNAFADYCEKQISKLMLGHADALSSAPGHTLNKPTGKETPEQIALDEIQAVDGRYVENAVNKQLIPKLRAIGFPIPAGLKFRYTNDGELQQQREEQDKNNTATFTWLLAASQAGLQLDPSMLGQLEEWTGFKFVEAPDSDSGDTPMTPSALARNLDRKAVQNKAK